MERISVLNPQSWVSPFEAVALNPRPNTLTGKTIGIVGQRHEPMLYLKDTLLAAMPDIKDVVILAEGRYSAREGFAKTEQEIIYQARPDTVIQGIAH